MVTTIDKEGLRAAYEDVRSDTSETNWAVFKHEGNCVVHISSGEDFAMMQTHFGSDVRGFAFIRVQVGDEMSKRMKFALITFIGSDVGAMKKAKMSTDKALVKKVILNFAVEIQAESVEEINEAYIKELVRKAGGADYGTGN